jgi:hypothetical protein
MLSLGRPLLLQHATNFGLGIVSGPDFIGAGRPSGASSARPPSTPPRTVPSARPASGARQGGGLTRLRRAGGWRRGRSPGPHRRPSGHRILWRGSARRRRAGVWPRRPGPATRRDRSGSSEILGVTEYWCGAPQVRFGSVGLSGSVGGAAPGTPAKGRGPLGPRSAVVAGMPATTAQTGGAGEPVPPHSSGFL